MILKWPKFICICELNCVFCPPVSPFYERFAEEECLMRDGGGGLTKSKTRKACMFRMLLIASFAHKHVEKCDPCTFYKQIYIFRGIQGDPECSESPTGFADLNNQQFKKRNGITIAIFFLQTSTKHAHDAFEAVNCVISESVISNVFIILLAPFDSKRPQKKRILAVLRVQSYQIVFPEVAKKFQKMPKSKFWQRNSPYFCNLAKNGPKLLQIGGKVAKICRIFWRKIATSGHSVYE